MLHGLAGCAVQWELVGGELARRCAAHAMAVDLPGYGETRATGAPLSIDGHARVVAELLAGGAPAVLVGNSMGGAIAARVAALRPEVVRGIVLVSSALPLPLAPAFPQPVFAMRNSAAMLPVVGPALLALYALAVSPRGLVTERMNAALAYPERLDPYIKERLVDLARDRERYIHRAADTYSASVRSLFAYLGSPWGMAADLARIECPALVIHGTLDRLIPVKQAQRLADARPDWRLEVYDDCGHVPQLEQPARFVDSLCAFAATL